MPTRLRGSDLAPPSALFPEKTDVAIVTGVRKICGEMVREAQNRPVIEIEILRHEIESLQEPMLPLITKFGS